MIQEGKIAPKFSANDSNGKTIKLSDFRGKKVVLYFYPKDDTPGCTVEACAFRDEYLVIGKKNTQVLGISPDNEASHEKFAKKFSLPFPLIADTDAKIAKAYGVWGEKSMFGIKYIGVLRTTFVLDEKGKILKIFEKVKPKGHAKEVLSVL